MGPCIGILANPQWGQLSQEVDRLSYSPNLQFAVDSRVSWISIKYGKKRSWTAPMKLNGFKYKFVNKINCGPMWNSLSQWWFKMSLESDQKNECDTPRMCFPSTKLPTSNPSIDFPCFPGESYQTYQYEHRPNPHFCILLQHQWSITDPIYPLVNIQKIWKIIII